jgi:hypothetical protein
MINRFSHATVTAASAGLILLTIAGDCHKTGSCAQGREAKSRSHRKDPAVTRRLPGTRSWRWPTTMAAGGAGRSSAR